MVGARDLAPDDSIEKILLKQLSLPGEENLATWHLLFQTSASVKDTHEVPDHPTSGKPTNDPMAAKFRLIETVLNIYQEIEAKDHTVTTLKNQLSALLNSDKYTAYIEARGAAKTAINTAWQRIHAINDLGERATEVEKKEREDAAKTIRKKEELLKKIDKDNKKILNQVKKQYEKTVAAIEPQVAQLAAGQNIPPEIIQAVFPREVLESHPAISDNPSDKTTLKQSYRRMNHEQGLKMSECLYIASKGGGANNPGEHGGNYLTLIWDNKKKRLESQVIFFKQATDHGMPNYREGVAGVLAGNIINACIGNLGASGFFSKAKDDTAYAASIFHDGFKDIHESAHAKILPKSFGTPNRAKWKLGGQWISFGNPFFKGGLEKLVQSDPQQAENLGRVMAANLLVANYQLHGNNVGISAQMTAEGKKQNNICGIDTDGAFRREYISSKEVPAGHLSTEIRPYSSKTRKHSTDYLAAYPDSIKLSAEFIKGVESIARTSRVEIERATSQGVEYAHQYFSPTEFAEFSKQLDTDRKSSTTPNEEKVMVSNLLTNTLVARQHSLAQWALELKVAHTLGGYKKSVPPADKPQYSLNKLINENYFSFLLNEKEMKKNLQKLGIGKNELKELDKKIRQQIDPDNQSLTIDFLKQQLKKDMNHQFVDSLSNAVICQMANEKLRDLMPANLRNGVQDIITPSWQPSRDIPDQSEDGSGKKISCTDTSLALTDSELQQFIRQMAGSNAVKIAEFRPTITFTAGNASNKIKHNVSVIEVDTGPDEQKGHVTPPRTSARLVSVTSGDTNRLYATPSLMREIKKEIHSATPNFENLYRMVNASIEKAITDLETTGPKVTALQMTPQAGTTTEWLAMMQYCCEQKGISFSIDPAVDRSKVLKDEDIQKIHKDINNKLENRCPDIGVIRAAP